MHGEAGCPNCSGIRFAGIMLKVAFMIMRQINKSIFNFAELEDLNLVNVANKATTHAVFSSYLKIKGRFSAHCRCDCPQQNVVTPAAPAPTAPCRRRTAATHASYPSVRL